MKWPRDISGDELAKSLSRSGYSITRQTGSHLRLTTFSGEEHHATIPKHKPIKIGTLNSILKEIAEHLGIDKNELIRSL